MPKNPKHDQIHKVNDGQMENQLVNHLVMVIQTNEWMNGQSQNIMPLVHKGGGIP